MGVYHQNNNMNNCTWYYNNTKQQTYKGFEYE